MIFWVYKTIKILLWVYSAFFVLLIIMGLSSGGFVEIIPDLIGLFSIMVIFYALRVLFDFVLTLSMKDQYRDYKEQIKKLPDLESSDEG